MYYWPRRLTGVTLSNASNRSKAPWSNEVIDGFSKNPGVLVAKE
jgi:hypothetical protein